MRPHTSLFTAVDRTDDPGFFVRFMDEAQKPAGIQAATRLMRERAHGGAVLDVGCGPGDGLFDLAEHGGAAGRLVGLDASDVMIAEARRRARERGAAVTFEVGDTAALPFPDASFDVCRAARLLEHLADPGAALAEMARVTRPGGRIVVFDFDWDTLIVDHPDKQATRDVVRTYSDSIVNGWVGRQLPRLLAEQDLAVLSIDPVQVFVHYALAELFLGAHLVALQADGTLAPEHAHAWWDELRRADAAGTLMIAFTAFVVAARR